jgi:uncharacterized membrane protein
MPNHDLNTGSIKPIECVREAWELVKEDYWILFAITLVGGLIGSVSLLIVLGPMICGIFYCYLRKIDRKAVSFDDLWKGFEWFGPGLVVTIAIVVPLFAVYVILYGPILAAAIMGSKLSQDELVAMLIGAVVVDLIVIVIMVCFHTLLMFSFPLIVDRNLGAIDAMTTSARAVWRNLGGVAGLILVNFGLAFAGYAALCFGIYLVMPVIITTNVVAYRRVFPALK